MRPKNMSAKEADAYYLGVEHGEQDAVNACFRSAGTPMPHFDDRDVACCYLEGYRDGYNSVD